MASSAEVVTVLRPRSPPSVTVGRCSARTHRVWASSCGSDRTTVDTRRSRISIQEEHTASAPSPIGGGRALFSADNGTTLGALWITDGTSSGTVLVKNLTSPSFGRVSRPTSPRWVMAASCSVPPTRRTAPNCGSPMARPRARNWLRTSATAPPRHPDAFVALGNGKVLFTASDPSTATRCGSPMARLRAPARARPHNASTLTLIALFPSRWPHRADRESDSHAGQRCRFRPTPACG